MLISTLDLGQLRRQAEELLAAAQAGAVDALERIAAVAAPKLK